MPRLAVLGHPVAHSRSPAMQNAALAELGLGGEWTYEAIDVAPEEFEARVRAMPGEGFAGANVTVPHKGAALALADAPSETAREIGAANTLSLRGAARSEADNTDAGGLLAALPGSPRGRAGAGARRRRRGPGGRSGRCCARAPRSRSGTGPRCARATSARSSAAGPVDAPDPAAYDLIVNTTAVGLARRGPVRAPAAARDGFAPGQVVVDMVYGERPRPLLGPPPRPGARPSTASRCWSSRARSRWRSGPGARRRSR